MTIQSTSISNQVLKPTGFYLSIAKFPDVAFQVQVVNIPEVSLGVAYQVTSEQDIAHPGDKLTYPPVGVSLLLDENMVGYAKLYGWMRDLSAFSVPQTDMADMMQRFGTQVSERDEDVCDVVLTVLNSHNNPVAEFRFIDAFPTMVGGFVFDTTDNGETVIRFDVQFAYTYFRLDPIKT